MSFFGFDSAGSAISAFQTAENLTADNIANVSTVGASRQQAVLAQQMPVDASPFLFANPGSVQPGTTGTGVLVSSILRIHQDSYDGLFRGATSSQSFFNIQQQQLTATQSALGEPTAGVNTAYVAFQSAVQQLAGNPSDAPSQSNLLTTATGLVNVLNNSGQSILSQEQQVIAQATQVVNQVNKISDQIAALNGQIRASKAVGNNPNTFLDQRDQLIDQLSGLLSTSTELQGSGSALITVDGKALVNDTVDYHLAAPVIGTTANGAPTLAIGFTNDPTPANPTSPVNVGGGSLGGYIDLYNNKLIPYKQSLDNFASGLVDETGRISQAGYDSTGTAGGQLFQPIVAANPVGAGNLQVGIASSSQLPIAAATTLAGSLVQPLNAANNTVDTSAALVGNATLANPPGAVVVGGKLTINIDGINPPLTVKYQIGGVVPAGTIDATTIDSFINGFNAQHLGITASFDSSSQRFVLSRDPANIDLVHRAEMAASVPPGVTTAAFTISDNLASAAQPALGQPAQGLFDALGATALSPGGVGVQQNSTNAFGSANAGDINALLNFFSQSYGAPAIQTTAVTPGTPAGVTTVTLANPVTGIHVGDLLTLDATAGGVPPQENVTVSAVNYNTNTITFNAVNAHGANFTVTSAQTQTLQSYYAAFVAKLGVDVQTATTGNTSQTSLASNIDQVRQSVDGINVDEETQNLIKYQNAYAAAAHVMAVLSSMLSDAINLGTGTTF